MRSLIGLGFAIVFGSAPLFAEVSSAGVIQGVLTSATGKPLPNAIVYVDSVRGEFKPPKEHVLMDQKGLEFRPHVLPILTGTTVDFRNSDNVMHNVFTPDEAGGKFNLGSWPQGEIRSQTFTKSCSKSCEAVLLCKVHPEMEAYVIILNNPYFSVTDQEGKYVISGVPPGIYPLRGWHERMKESTAKASVGTRDTVVVNLTLKR